MSPTPVSISQIPPGHPDPPPGVDKCPVDHSSRQAWTNLASAQLQNPDGSQSRSILQALSTKKQVSSIPRGAVDDGSKAEDKWVYPSEAQFYAALLRKHQATSSGDQTVKLGEVASHGDTEVDSGGNAVTNGNIVGLPEKRDMSVVVPIHNAVNERTWQRILEWEAGRGGESCGGIRLLSFRGDSRKLSPKARWNILLGYQRPFDRHDWVVDRCGTKVRYVIDYYTGKVSGNNGSPASFYIDARPALDSWEGVKLRISGLWQGLIGYTRRD